MANIKAKIRKNPDRIVAQTIKVGNLSLTDLSDIDASQNTDGAMLIYNGTTTKFTLKPEIANSNTTFNGGTY
jgi:hypothetical protein